MDAVFRFLQFILTFADACLLFFLLLPGQFSGSSAEEDGSEAVSSSVADGT